LDQKPQVCHVFQHRGRDFEICVDAHAGLQLWYAGVCRKARSPSALEPWYVWTNVELEWEEHHYLEVRYWHSQQRLCITVNREPAYDGPLQVAS